MYIQKSDKTKTIYFIYSIFVCLFLLATVYLQERLSYFDYSSNSYFTDFEALLLTAICLFLAAILIIVAHKHYQILPNWGIFLFFAVVFVIDVIAVVSFKVPQNFIEQFGDTFEVTTMYRIRCILGWLEACVAFYLFIAILPKTARSERSWDFLFYGCIVITLIAIVYSYIFEKDVYTQLLAHADDLNNAYYPVSFMVNRNSYGWLLTMGLGATAWLNARHFRWIDFIIALFIYANEFLVMSKTCLVISTCFIFCYLIWLYCVSVRKKKVLCNCFLALFIVVLIAAFIFVKCGFIERFGTINRVYQELILSIKNINLSTLEFRKPIWEAIFSMGKSDTTIFWFGCGDYNFDFFLSWVFSSGKVINVLSPHSGFIGTFGRLGILGLGMYALLLLFLFYHLLKGMFKRRKLSVVSFMLFVTVLVHGLIENTGFFDMSCKDAYLFASIFLPVLTEDYQERHKEIVSNQMDLYSGTLTDYSKGRLSVRSVALFWYFLLLPLFIISISWNHYLDVWFIDAYKFSVYGQIANAVLYFTLPLIIAGSVSLFREKKGFFGLLLILASFGITAAYLYFQPQRDLVWPVILVCSLAMLLLLTFAFSRSRKLVLSMIVPGFVYLLIGCLMSGLIVMSQYLYLDTHPENSSQLMLLFLAISLPWSIILVSDHLRFFLFYPLNLRWSKFEDSLFKKEMHRDVLLSIRIGKIRGPRPVEDED